MFYLQQNCSSSMINSENFNTEINLQSNNTK